MSSHADSVEVVYVPGVQTGWVLREDRCALHQPQEETTRHYALTTLDIEKVIAARLEEYGAEVTRVVHSFGGRDIHLRDGSRVEYRWQLIVSDWRCLDCGVDTDAIAEYYMLHDELWDQIHPDNDGQLCIACVERRLSRELIASDFTDADINTSARFKRSPALTNRLGQKTNLP